MRNPGLTLTLTLLASFSTGTLAALGQAPGAVRTAPAAGAPALITRIPGDYQPPQGGWMPRCNPARNVCAYVAQKGAQTFVVTNGTAGAAFEEIKDIVFSQDGGHIAYAARRGTSWLVVTDGKEGPPFTKVENLTFLGSVSIYVGSRPPAPRLQAGQFGGSSDIEGFRDSRKAAEQNVMVVGDRFDDIPVVEDRFLGINDLTVSPDGKSYAYVIRISAGRYGLWLLNLNSEPLAEDHGIVIFSFTTDGRLAFARRTGSTELGTAKVQIGPDDAGVRTPDIPGDIVAGTATPDGKKLLYVACTGPRDKSRCSLMTGLDAKVLREGIFEAPTIAPNGTTFAFGEKQPDGKLRVMVGDQPGPPIDSLSGPIVFSPNSRRHAYAAKLGGKNVVVIDAVVGPAFDTVRGIRFSADSRHLAYSAVTGGAHRIVIDQVAGQTAYTWVTEPDFDASGESVAFVAQEDRSFWRRTAAVRR